MSKEQRLAGLGIDISLTTTRDATTAVAEVTTLSQPLLAALDDRQTPNPEDPDVLKYTSVLTKYGAAKRNPEDEPNPLVGELLATARALDAVSARLKRQANGLVKHADDQRVAKLAEGPARQAKKEAWLEQLAEAGETRPRRRRRGFRRTAEVAGDEVLTATAE